MWNSEELKAHINTSSTVQTRSLVVSEWNMNVPGNIVRAGNYRYRPYERLTLPLAEQSPYAALQNAFDILDAGNFYTGATDSDIIVDGGYTDLNADVPAIFKSKKDKENLLYSLEDCFGKFRPRSGINKVRYLESAGQYLHHPNVDMFQRPRFYMAHKDDQFKYWTSYRTDGYDERGIAVNFVNNKHYIDDAAPFVVYKNAVPANKIVVKMQTGVGDIDLGPFRDNSGQFDDPFFGDANRSVPERWSIQYLENNSWITAISFDENTIRTDGTNVIGNDGYVEVSYGLIVPTKYIETFKHAGTLVSALSLPDDTVPGYGYLVGSSDVSAGVYHVWTGDAYETFVPEYGWSLKNDGIQTELGLIDDLTNPSKFINPMSSQTQYRELQYISGLRVVVETMTKNDAIFDLIEMSPRLAVNLTDKVVGYSVAKPASDLGISGMPVGQLLAGTGTLNIFDYDMAFSKTNTQSVIADFITQNIQIKFYEVIANVSGIDYYVPLKTLYSEGFPAIDSNSREVSLSLRDMFFYFEFTTAPQILLSNVSLSYAVATLLDYVGFSNYVFKRLPNESDPTIENFFIAPDKTIAQVLQDLAIATQSAMFFDEYNNFVVMSKGYMMPSESDRSTDTTLYGSKDFQPSGVLKNKKSQEDLSNIVEISSQENSVFNSGVITYTSRYIEREQLPINFTEKESDQYWVYRPAQLWSVSPPEQGRISKNNQSSVGGYVLSAIPLNADLTNELPYVLNNKIYNNQINFGEAAHFLDRYNGYFYANGEVIKFDAVQYSVPGLTIGEDSEDGSTVWITSAREYEKYFSKIPFNGKIYPTGAVRIYAEPNYETINGITRLKNGPVAKHGRCQFGTGQRSVDGSLLPAYHSAGLNSYWSDNNNVRGVNMQSSYLFTQTPFKSESAIINGKSITDSVATITTTYAHGFVVGDTVVVAGVDDTLNGQWTVTAIGNKSFTYSLFLDELTDQAFQAVDSSDAEAYIIRFDTGVAGEANSVASRSSRTGFIKNFLSSSYIPETDTNRMLTDQSATVQSSALVFSGGTFLSTENPLDYVSYINKPLDSSYKHFGTRVRIIGKVENDENRLQTPVGVTAYYQVSEVTPEKTGTIGGASAGLAVMVDSAKNTGYYFEIVALTANNIAGYVNDVENNYHDVVFYKVLPSAGKAVPVKLWGGNAGIITDSGSYTGQSRLAAEDTTVYDLAVEYETFGNTRRFYLYLNNSLIQIIDDEDPLPIINNMAPFIRGASRAMFENIYALTNNYSQNTATSVNLPASSAFSNGDISVNDSLRKYAMSGIIQSTYLSGISPSEPPAFDMYFEEFGTIMREAAYFNARYDKAYPALYAKLAPARSNLKGYTVSGFMAGSYKAEFLIFNASDKRIVLGDKGNELDIHGITFTSEANNEYTVDDYFSRRSDFSKPQIFNGNLIVSPEKESNDYYDIKTSRLTYGRNEFSLASPYIQTAGDAENLMGWMVSKIMKPRLSVGVRIFSNPMIQLGDIVNIVYKNTDGEDIIVSDSARFIVYNIQHDRDSSGPSMTIYLSEVK
jgi:hypothetical protein